MQLELIVSHEHIELLSTIFIFFSHFFVYRDAHSTILSRIQPISSESLGSIFNRFIIL